MRRGSNLQPGNLLTREERLQLRFILEDLHGQLDRATDVSRRTELERLIRNVEMERAEDRRTRPRRKKIR